MNYLRLLIVGSLLVLCSVIRVVADAGTATAPTIAPAVAAAPAGTILPASTRLGIVGDSITEQKLYSKYIEAYLRACAGRNDLAICQFGWGGETAGGFATRVENDLADFKPTVVTLCYGMNDGGYRPYDPNIGTGYEKGMRVVLEKLGKLGVKTVVVGSPGAVDTKYFQRPWPGGDNTKAAAGYNDNLQQLRNIDEKLAAEAKMPFADVHGAMIDAMAKAKAVLGDDYDVCGHDGVHPSPDGQLVMAYAFLKALGCDGNIGEITVDLKGGAQVSPGHKILKADGGVAEIESSRYPFCFDGDAKGSGGTRSIVPFLPFNQDLNRFVLKVKNLDAAKAKVTWGDETKEFTREQLATGINLAAEFGKTPFDAAFAKLLAAVAAKQNYETMMIKGLVTQFRWVHTEFKDDAELQTAEAAVRKRLAARQADLETAARDAVVPVKHTLTVVPVQ